MANLTEYHYGTLEEAIADNPARNGSDVFRMPVKTERKLIPVGNGVAPDNVMHVATFRVQFFEDEKVYRWMRVD
jgi:hypothetical protein